MYLYDTHVHSSECSACALSGAREMVQAYHEAGYAGMILTNHFVHGNTNVPRELDWDSRMKRFYDVYLEAKEEGQRCDLDVLFGLEDGYGKGKEILIYGVDLDFLLAHPELDTVSIETCAVLVHDAGGILVHAHPYRIRNYIVPNVKPWYDICDGIEVYNASDTDEFNELAFQDALRLGKIMTSGGDVHQARGCAELGLAGIGFHRRIKDISNFVNALKHGEGHIMFHGEMRTSK